MSSTLKPLEEKKDNLPRITIEEIQTVPNHTPELKPLDTGVSNVFDTSIKSTSLQEMGNKKSIPTLRPFHSASISHFFSKIFTRQTQPPKSVKKLAPLEEEMRSVIKSLIHIFTDLYPTLADVIDSGSRFLPKSLLFPDNKLHKASTPLNIQKNRGEIPTRSDIVVRQCFKWLYYKLIQSDHKFKNVFADTVKEIASHLTVTELNSLKFMLTFHKHKDNNTVFSINKEESKDPLDLINDPEGTLRSELNQLIAAELNERAKNHHWVKKILAKGLDFEKELFENELFRESVIRFLKSEARQNDLGEFFSLMHDFKSLFRDDKVQLVAIDLSNLKLEESKINFEQIKIHSDPEIEQKKLGIVTQIYRLCDSLNTSPQIIESIQEVLIKIPDLKELVVTSAKSHGKVSAKIKELLNQASIESKAHDICIGLIIKFSTEGEVGDKINKLLKQTSCLDENLTAQIKELIKQARTKGEKPAKIQDMIKQAFTSEETATKIRELIKQVSKERDILIELLKQASALGGNLPAQIEVLLKQASIDKETADTIIDLLKSLPKTHERITKILKQKSIESNQRTAIENLVQKLSTEALVCANFIDLLEQTSIHVKKTSTINDLLQKSSILQNKSLEILLWLQLVSSTRDTIQKFFTESSLEKVLKTKIDPLLKQVSIEVEAQATVKKYLENVLIEGKESENFIELLEQIFIEKDHPDPENLFLDLEKNQIALYFDNFGRKGALVPYWKSRSFFYYCLAATCPLFETVPDLPIKEVKITLDVPVITVEKVTINPEREKKMDPSDIIIEI